MSEWIEVLFLGLAILYLKFEIAKAKKDIDNIGYICKTKKGIALHEKKEKGKNGN